jgi:hypothetical protein
LKMIERTLGSVGQSKLSCNRQVALRARSNERFENHRTMSAPRRASVAFTPFKRTPTGFRRSRGGGDPDAIG